MPNPSADPSSVFPGADERTPSRSQYFSWINHTNEGPTEAQTLANLGFFRYLHDAFGMRLDIYAFDAGAIDGAKFYGSMDSDRFRRRFPRGFAPLRDAAAAMGTRLGLWGGPDGFGDTPEETRARIEMMVGLCRDHRMALFKMDAVCGQLRPEHEHEDAFVEMMTRCREHSPDLILLNHRLKLGKGMPHATTFLWEGVETYIDVHIASRVCAPHNRAGALARGLPPGLARLTEDHGVCLSSCLDYWADDLILHAFNRCLILAPEIYGNPWLLRDDELPLLARIYNLHRRYRAILVDGIVLPEAEFGPHAVARGDGDTRLITLRNLSWDPRTIDLPLDSTLGLESGGQVEVRTLFPFERVLGTFAVGQRVPVEVGPYRAALVLITRDPATPGIGVEGVDARLVRDVPGRPVEIDLLGEPGTTAQVVLHGGGQEGRATLDGQPVPAPHRPFVVEFPGPRLGQPWHRKLGDLVPVDVPPDAEALYEATCFAADNNALELRELARSGPTAIPEVQAARDAYFGQPLFRSRNLSDRHLFDDDPSTGFGVNRRWRRDLRIRNNGFRLDLGTPTRIDHLRLVVGDEYRLQPLHIEEGIFASVSADLRTWRRVGLFITEDIAGPLPDDQPIRYIRLDGCPDFIQEVRGMWRGRPLDRSGWRASMLFANYGGWGGAGAVAAWSLTVRLDEAPPGSYLAIALHGEHGPELAYAAARMGEGYLGAPRRSPSFPANTFEVPVREAAGNTTYYIPVTPDMLGAPLDLVALLFNGGNPDLRPEAWITACPEPRVRRRLTLARP